MVAPARVCGGRSPNGLSSVCLHLLLLRRVFQLKLKFAVLARLTGQ